MTPPTIHMNGTSRSALVDGYAEAYAAIGEAINAVKETAPNGRDYYVQGAGALEKAIAEHDARLKRLHDVREEFEQLVNLIEGA